MVVRAAVLSPEDFRRDWEGCANLCALCQIQAAYQGAKQATYDPPRGASLISAHLPRLRPVAAACVVFVVAACGPRSASFVPPSAAFLDLAVVQRPSSTASVQVDRYETPSTLNVEFVEFPTTEVAIQRGRLEYSGGVLELQLFFAGEQYDTLERWLTDPRASASEKMILVNMALLADGTCVVDHSRLHRSLAIRTEAPVDTYNKLVGIWGAE